MLTIKQQQMNLKYLGYYNDKIDGIKGKNTIAGIKAFQKAYGLVVDGIFGSKTNAKMIQVIKQEQARLGVKQDGIAGDITTNARNNQLSWDNIKYFKKSEFTCNCGCGLNNIDLKLVKVLDEIREHFGQPIKVTSGCRCQKYNNSLRGSSKTSRHLQGKAADIIVRNVNKNTALSYAKQLVSQGKLRYTYTNSTNMGNAIHVDIK